MSNADRELVASCYRTLREVASRCKDRQEAAAISVACCAVLRAMGKEAPPTGLDKTINEILESHPGYLFVPLL